MVTLHRSIEPLLASWKTSKSRKVLMLRGARQVGKTFSVREFSKGFSSFVELNFYEHPELHNFFRTGPLDPQTLVEKLGAYFSVSIKAGETLVFFDEIQACPEALGALRFFHEKMPDLHLVVAGSLLEFAIADIPSFGVGRIESLFLYPLSFSEFLQAQGHEQLLKQIEKADPEHPMDNALQSKSLDLLRIYLTIGGLPEVVQTYIQTRDLLQCERVLRSLVVAYEDDFAKYKDKAPVSRIREVFRACARQAGEKFIYAQVCRERTSYGDQEALGLLEQAGLIYKVYHSSANGIPLGAEINHKRFKVVFFDVGIYNRILGLSLGEYLTMDFTDLVNKGKIAEIFAGLELISSGSPFSKPEIFYWHRESKSSNAEVDYLLQVGAKVVPVEVKAGTKGSMQSMFRFLAEKSQNLGVRVSSENFSRYEHISVIPLYAVHQLRRICGNS